ncbi:biotin/lipoyl-binding protein, partial [bacterium]|nr:biotin/lipoyl-binding protein [bacterium]
MFSQKVKTMLGLVVLLLPWMINSCSPSQIPVSGAASTNTQKTATWLDQPVMALDSELVAEGRVVPLKHVNLSFPSVGVVDEVNFEEGAQVQKGQVIARLNGAEKMAAEVVSAEVVVFTVKKEKEDLIENAIYSRIQAELKLVEAQRALEKAQKARNSKNYKRGSDYQIDVATADYKTLEEQFKMLRDYFNTLSGRSEDDLERSNALLKMNEAKAKLDGALNTLNTL